MLCSWLFFLFQFYSCCVAWLISCDRIVASDHNIRWQHAWDTSPFPKKKTCFAVPGFDISLNRILND